MDSASIPDTDRIIYLDNAATTFPKPRETLSEMLETYARMGCLREEEAMTGG